MKPLLNVGISSAADKSISTISVKDLKSSLPTAIPKGLSKQQNKAIAESVCDDGNEDAKNSANFSRTPKKVKTKNAAKSYDSVKMTRSSREKMLQEKEDFQLAKMLQECVGTADSPSNGGSMRYSLRSRNKSSVSSLSSSSSHEFLHNKGYPLAVSKFKKTTAFGDNTKDLFVGRSMRNAANDKIIDFNFQKLTRSRRIAMTMSGV